MNRGINSCASSMKISQDEWNKIMDNSEENPSIKVVKKKGSKTIYVYKPTEEITAKTTSSTDLSDPIPEN